MPEMTLATAPVRLREVVSGLSADTADHLVARCTNDVAAVA